MYKLVIGLLSLICITSCNFQQQEAPVNLENNTSVLTIDKETFQKEYGDCKTDTSVYCTKVIFNYPIISGIDSAISNEINNKLKQVILRQYLKDSISTNYAAYTSQFIDDYKNIKSKFGEAFGWYTKVNSHVVYSDTARNILALETSTSIYTGGAHGTDEVYYINFNLADGSVYELNDVFKVGFEPKLNELALKNFKSQTDTTELLEFNFEENQFYNTNFGLLKEGIKFYYNPYEIAPYSSGASEIYIPYSEVQDLIKLKNHN